MINQTSKTIFFALLLLFLASCATQNASQRPSLSITFQDTVEVDFRNGNISRMWRFSAQNIAGVSIEIPVEISYDLDATSCVYVVHANSATVESRSVGGDWIPPQVVLEEVEVATKKVTINAEGSAYLLAYERRFVDEKSNQGVEFRFAVRDSSGLMHTSLPYRGASGSSTIRLGNLCQRENKGHTWTPPLKQGFAFDDGDDGSGNR